MKFKLIALENNEEVAYQYMDTDKVIGDSKDEPYGICPTCGEPGVSTERRMNGNSVCVNGHTFPNTHTVRLIPINTFSSGFIPEKKIVDDTTDQESVIGNLNVDKVYEEEHAPDEVLEIIDDATTEMTSEYENNQEMIDGAVNTSGELVAIAETLQESINTFGYINPVAIKISMLSLESHRKNMSFKDKLVKVSLEDYKNDKVVASKVALESFVDTIKKLWQAIIKAIMDSIAWIKKFFTEFVFAISHDIKNLKEITFKILEQREKDTTGKLKKSMSIGFDPEYYILPTLTNRNLQAMLSINNKQPDNYSQAFKEILNIINVDTYKETFNSSFVESLEKVYENSILQDKTPDAFIDFKPERLIPLNADIGHGLDKDVNKTFKNLVAKEGQRFFMTDPTLGNYVILHEFKEYYFIGNYNSKDAANSDLETLENIANWSITEQSFLDSNNNKNALRYLSSAEIKEGSDSALNVLNYINTAKGKLDELINIKNSLVILSKKASNFESDLEDKLKMQYAGLLIKCVSNINKISTELPVNNFKYARSQCNAWMLYLAEIYKKERDIINS